jgi:hypothetical protein
LIPKRYILILIGLLLGFNNSSAQTDLVKRADIQKRKIKIIKHSKYIKWDRYKQKPVAKGILTDITIDHYDTLGNLDYETNETFDTNATEVMNFRYDYHYDKYGNLIAEHLQNKFLPMDSKWEYKYDSRGNLIEKTEFDLHQKPHQTRYYFYNKDGVIISDSLTQQGEPLTVTNYIYSDGKLVMTIEMWAIRVKFQLANETKYYYNNKGLLIKKETYDNHSTDYKLEDSTLTFYKYDKKNRLIKTQIDKRVIEDYYDNNDNIIKEVDYREMPAKKYSYKIPDYEILEYEHY